MLASAALGAGGLLLPGCATTGATPPAAAPTGCLPPVEVSESRLIRTAVGLRPYRAPGFVVRAEALGDKRLVHNYGHGGAGITLSWGSARLATALGLPEHQGAVAVIGAGVMGLTTARLVQEAGFPVTLYAAALPPETTSNVAGGQFHPFGHFREDAVTPEWRAQFRAAADYSWRRFQIMIGDDYGIRWLPTYTEASAPEWKLLPTFPPVNRVLGRGEHPFPVESIVRYDTLYVETGRFLRQLIRDVESSGGRIAVRSFDSPAAIAALPERLVFNCTGLGARALFGDEALQPARGQLAILLPQPEVRYAFTGSAGYMFPRADGIILGGTFGLGDWSLEPDPATTARILRRHQALFEGLRCTA
ncbi:FAD-binding oxidoreductase [Sphingomonas parva]|uniref:D-amino-acid oxidase n=1 Tax=Sphingomonas parva TaxID=2555898 RepID=A0A4Y8ZU71_9SPHN|nr:FAD-binding oxidoreductase [Sphingomonas parva]